MNPGQKTLGRPLSRLLIASAIAAAFPAYANDASEIEKLKAQIEELDQKLKILGRKQELVNEDVAAKQKAAPTVTASDRGFGFKSQDGQFEYRLRGLVHVDYRHFEGDAFPDATNGFLARRIRPTFEGTVFGKYGFRFTPEFGENKANVIDAYLDVREKPEAQIRIGKFKPFVGLERLQSGGDIKFIERSYVSNNILPNRDLGISLFGDVLENKVNYAVGIFNGATDGGENTTAQDLTSAKDFAARVFVTPFSNTDSALKGLGFGIAATVGNNKGSTTTDYRGRVSAISSGLSNYKTPGQANTFYNFRSQISTTTAADNDFVVADGDRVRYTPQAYFYSGPFGLIAEYAQSTQSVRRYTATTANTWTTTTGAATELKSTAWQLAGSWLLTGEDASFRGVKPYSPFKLGAEGGWGAVELVARYQENKLDNDYAAFADKQRGYALGARTFGVGLNWYLNQASKFAINYERTSFSNVTAASAATTNSGGALYPGQVAKNPFQGNTEHFLVARYQLSF